MLPQGIELSKDEEEEEESDDIDDDGVYLENLMDDPAGNAQVKQDITVKNKFNAFLKERFKSQRSLRNKPSKPLYYFETVPIDDINRKLVGQWAAYLIEELGSGMNYMSSIRRQLEDARKCTFFNENENFVTKLRTKMRKKYVARAIERGENVTNKAPSMTMDDKQFMSRTLFKAGDVLSMKDRNLLDKQWVLIGRSSDVGDLLWTHMTWNGKHLALDCSRVKVSGQQTVTAFVGASWDCCPIHSLASQLVCDPDNVGPRVFDQWDSSQGPSTKAINKVSAYINRVFKRIYSVLRKDGVDRNLLTKGLTSHSSRRGPAGYAAQNRDCHLHEISRRGLWAVEAYATVLEYICGTSYGDQKIGRVLSGWPDANEGGVPPSLSPFDSEERTIIKKFFEKIFLNYISRIDSTSFLEVLGCTLLIHLADTLELAPEHNMHFNMVTAASGLNIMNGRDKHAIAATLCMWGAKIKTKFVIDNIMGLTIETVQDMISDDDLEKVYMKPNTFLQSTQRLFVMNKKLAAVNAELLSRVQEQSASLKMLQGQVTSGFDEIKKIMKSGQGLQLTETQTEEQQLPEPVDEDDTLETVVCKKTLMKKVFTSFEKIFIQSAMMRFLQHSLLIELTGDHFDYWKESKRKRCWQRMENIFGFASKIIMAGHDLVPAGKKTGVDYSAWHSRTMEVLPLFQMYMCIIVEYCLQIIKINEHATVELAAGEKFVTKNRRKTTLSGTVTYIERKIVNPEMVCLINSSLKVEFLIRLPGNMKKLNKHEATKITGELESLRSKCFSKLFQHGIDASFGRQRKEAERKRKRVDP